MGLRILLSVAPLFISMPEQLVYFQQINTPIAPMHFDLLASEDGEVLAFKNAILARAETNKNNDEIDTQGIRDLARTIVGRAIDVEHSTGLNMGAFVAARPIDGDTALSVDGFMWADRYPEETKGFMNGTHSLSVEASAQKAICSICNETFSSVDEYCMHLQAKAAFGAVRRLRGLKGKGGGVTTHPAGTDTRADPTQIYFVASHNDMEAAWYDKYLKERGETLKDLPNSDFADPEGRRFPYKIHGEVKEEGWRAAWSAANGGHTGKKDEGAIAKLRRDKPKGVEIKESTTEVTMKEDKPVVEAVASEEAVAAAAPAANPEEACNNTRAQTETPEEEKKEEKKENEGEASTDAYAKFMKDLEAMTAQMTTMKSSMDELKAKVTEMSASLDSFRLASRHQAVAPFMSEEEWNTQVMTIKAMDDSGFALFASTLNRKQPLSMRSSVRLPEPVAGGTKEPLTL